jgi:hypothetical protein
MSTNPKAAQEFIGTMALLLLWAAAGAVHAAFDSDFSVEPFNPDLFNAQLSLDYDYNAGDGTSVLNISGNGPGSFTDINGVETDILQMTFSLQANFASAGSELLAGSTVSILSQDPFLPLGIPLNSVLLGGTIYDFSIDSKGDGAGTFYFLLENTYSDVADILGWGNGASGQIVFNADFNDAPGWENGNVNFDSSGQIVPLSSSDTSVPAPAPLALLGVGLIALRLLRRPRG